MIAVGFTESDYTTMVVGPNLRERFKKYLEGRFYEYFGYEDGYEVGQLEWGDKYDFVDHKDHKDYIVWWGLRWYDNLNHQDMDQNELLMIEDVVYIEYVTTDEEGLIEYQQWT